MKMLGHHSPSKKFEWHLVLHQATGCEQDSPSNRTIKERVSVACYDREKVSTAGKIESSVVWHRFTFVKSESRDILIAFNLRLIDSRVTSVPTQKSRTLLDSHQEHLTDNQPSVGARLGPRPTLHRAGLAHRITAATNPLRPTPEHPVPIQIRQRMLLEQIHAVSLLRLVERKRFRRLLVVIEFGKDHPRITGH